MSAPAKMSRNRQRKQRYAAQADAGSRNQVTLEGPIVGHFERVPVMVACRGCDGDKLTADGEVCGKCGGSGLREKRDSLGRVVTVETIVHDESKPHATEPALVIPRTPKREPKAQARRRQLAAWARCAYATAHETSGQHDFSGRRGDVTYRTDRCITCGCPSDEVEVVAGFGERAV